jgi:hypothetical protein
VTNGHFEAEITWDGRTGTMTGRFTTPCSADPAPFEFSCGGHYVGHGSGDLDGVTFHIDWGPGTWPFDHEGFALDPHLG